MSHLDEQLKKLDEVKKEDTKKKGKFKLFAILGGCALTLALGVGMFFLIKGAASKFEITQSSNVAGEEATTIVSQKGNEVTLTAKDLNGYRFQGWQAEGGNNLVSNSKTYTFTIDDNTPNKFLAIYAKEYNVQVDADIENGTVIVDLSVAIENEEVEIEVIEGQYYRLKSLTVTQGTTEIEVVDNRFVMPAGDVRITAEFEKVDFLVTVPTTQTGYTLKNADGTPFTTTSVKANEDISFKVELEDAYSQSAVTVKNGNEVLTPDNNGIYTVENVTGNVNITVEGVTDVNTYTVILPEQTGYTLITPDNTPFTTTRVEHNGTLAFKVQLDTAYSQSLDNVVVRCNGAELTAVEGVYTVANITGNVTITVEGVQKNTYSVTVPATQEHYTIKNADNTPFTLTTVEYGTQLTFKVVLEDGYTQNEIVVKNNTEVLTEENGVYTIEVTNDVSITVEGVTNVNTYDVTLPTEQTGYLLKNLDDNVFEVTSVEYDDTISFKVELQTAYSESTVVVKNNGVVLTPNNQGVYTVANITENVTITVEGVQKNTYSVTLPTEQTGYTLQNASNNPLTIESLEYGADLTFKVELEDAYTQSVVVVKNGENTLTPNDQGVYTVANVTANIEITVSGLTLNLYTITFPAEVTVTRNSTALTTGDTVYHYDTITLSPTTQPEDGYIAVYTVTGAEETANANEYIVTGAVTIEYSVEEFVGAPSDYPSLYFKNYSSSPYTVKVGAINTDISGDIFIPSKVKKNNKIYSVTTIFTEAFMDCTQITSVKIPKSVTSISERAFQGCTALQEVTFSDNSELDQVKKGAFSGCSELISIELPASITSMASSIFNGCSKLSNLAIPFVGSSLDMVYGTNWYPFAYIFGTTEYEGGVGVEHEYFVDSQYKSATYYIPSSLRTLTIHGGAIHDYSFPTGNNYSDDININCLIIGDNVTSINNGAFASNYNLRCVIFSENSSIMIIGEAAFSSCSALKMVILPQDLVSIQSSAFYGCRSLTSITIPSNVERINTNAFKECYNLKTVNNFSRLSIYTSHTANGYVGYYADRILYKDETKVDEVEEVNGVIYHKIGDEVYDAISIKKPSTNQILSNKTTAISSYLFSNCVNLTSLTIPSSVVSIGEYAFSNCVNLENIILEENSQLTSVGTDAFKNCTELKKVTIANIEDWLKIKFSTICYTGYAGQVEDKCYSNPLYYAKHLYIGEEEITEVVIPNTITTIQEGAFLGCIGITSITIPSSVVSIGNYAFNYCSGLNKVIISDLSYWLNMNYTIANYGNCSYANPLYYAKHLYIGEEKITEIVIPNTLTEIKNMVFYGWASLTKVTFEENSQVETINWYAFYNCSGLTSIEFAQNSSLKEISQCAFQNCASLNCITIPSSVTRIARDAFQNCTGLTSVIFEENSQLKSVGDSAFKNCTSLVNIILPNSVTSLGSYSFEYSAITRLPFNNDSQITTLGSSVFWGCKYLTIAIIPSNVTTIGLYAFRECYSLVSITIPSSVTSMERYFYVFYDCNSLKEIYNLSSITISTGSVDIYTDLNAESKLETENGVIYYKKDVDSYIAVALADSRLTEVILSEKTTEIDSYAFYECSIITKVTIPNNVKSIGQYAFYGCAGLANVIMSSSVTSVGSYAFYRCNSLKTVVIEGEYAYNNATSTSRLGYLLQNATTVKVLASIVDDTSNTNTYLNNTSNYTKSEKTTIDGKEYYIYTKK